MHTHSRFPSQVATVTGTAVRNSVEHAELPSVRAGYGWPPICDGQRGLPVFLLDLDGTLRGDVRPMVKLARPLVPDLVAKLKGRAPLHMKKAVRFVSGVSKLWLLRVVHREHRRRYKYVFSELHHVAAALLQNISADALRRMYAQQIPGMHGLWHDAAGTLLKRLTRDAIAVLITGSEQLQTEECVRLLQPLGVDLSRIYVRGSLYAYDAQRGRFSGKVEHLNVSLDGKRDAVRNVTADHAQRIAGAIGNSRPDRALFEAADPRGLCALVCPKSVLARRRQNTFALRKIQRHGYQIAWDIPSYESALREFLAHGIRRPLLATESSLSAVLSCLDDSPGSALDNGARGRRQRSAND